jgi:hypothetical protein
MQLNMPALHACLDLHWVCVSKHVSAYIPGGIPDAMEWQTISVTIVVTSYCRTEFATVGRTPFAVKRPTVQSTVSLPPRLTP